MGTGAEAIAAAVVTHDGQVLLIRRAVAEGALSWQFPAGKLLTGENAGEAAVREAREETGIEVIATHLLGERIHPETDAHVVYVACNLAGGTARVVSAREVAEVRWVSQQEADDLTGGTIFEPVRASLSANCGNRGRSPAG